MRNRCNIKTTLYARCQTYVQDRLTAIQTAIDAARESANPETKSSAGDKDETGRAMAQNERDRNPVLLVLYSLVSGSHSHSTSRTGLESW